MLISCEKILMSAELKRYVTWFIYFLDLLWGRYNCAKFHHWRICVTDFRERGLFAPPPIREQPRKSPTWIGLRILTIFRGKFYYLSLATVAADINVETLKENGILLPQFAQNVEEARFLGNITGWDYLLGNWFKIKFLQIWLYFYMTVFS